MKLFLAIPGFLKRVVCFPYILFQLWHILDHRANSDWNQLITRIRRLQRIGYITRDDIFMLAFAYAELELWKEALEEFEKIDTPLANVDEEACRCCTHAYVLYKLGRCYEALSFLNHSIRSAWPQERINWAERFLVFLSQGEQNPPPIVRPN
jgi:hypothetical protein